MVVIPCLLIAFVRIRQLSQARVVYGRDMVVDMLVSVCVCVCVCVRVLALNRFIANCN